MANEKRKMHGRELWPMEDKKLGVGVTIANGKKHCVWVTLEFENYISFRILGSSSFRCSSNSRQLLHMCEFSMIALQLHTSVDLTKQKYKIIFLYTRIPRYSARHSCSI